jgi:hypothetical protein
MQARAMYARGLSSGLRNDINDDQLAMRQVRGARSFPLLQNKKL